MSKPTALEQYEQMVKASANGSKKRLTSSAALGDGGAASGLSHSSGGMIGGFFKALKMLRDGGMSGLTQGAAKDTISSISSMSGGASSSAPLAIDSGASAMSSDLSLDPFELDSFSASGMVLDDEEASTSQASEGEELSSEITGGGVNEIGGLPTPRAMVRMMGGASSKTRLVLHSSVRELFSLLKDYQTLATTPIDLIASFKTEGLKTSELRFANVFDKLYKVSVVASAFTLKDNKSERIQAFMPSVVMLLNACYRTIPSVVAAMKNAPIYAMRNGGAPFTPHEYLHSRMSKVASGKMLSYSEDNEQYDTSIFAQQGVAVGLKQFQEDPLAFLDKSADTSVCTPDFVKIENSVFGQQSTSDEATASSGRRLPMVGEQSYFEELKRIATYIDDFGFVIIGSKTVNKSHTTMLEKTLQIAVQKQDEVQAFFNKGDVQKPASSSVGMGSSESAQYVAFILQQVQGVSIREAMAFIENNALEDPYETPEINGTSVIGNEGGCSEVVIERSKGLVHRSTKKKIGRDKKKYAAVHYDEAMSKVNDFFGFGVMAKAETTAIKTVRNGVGFGTKMALAKGGSVRDKGNKEFFELIQKPKFLEDLFRMQVLDYILMHVDRHCENYLVNEDAAEDEAMITGIDNDGILGYCPNEQMKQLYYELSEDQIGKLNEKRLDANDEYIAYHRDFQMRELMSEKFRRVATAGIVNKDRDIDADIHSVNLQTGFGVVPKKVFDAVNDFDIAGLDEVLQPYVGQTVRASVMKRAIWLKQKFASGDVKPVDVQDEEQRRELVNHYLSISLRSLAVDVEETSRGNISQDFTPALRGLGGSYLANLAQTRFADMSDTTALTATALGKTHQQLREDGLEFIREIQKMTGIDDEKFHKMMLPEMQKKVKEQLPEGLLQSRYTGTKDEIRKRFEKKK